MSKNITVTSTEQKVIITLAGNGSENGNEEVLVLSVPMAEKLVTAVINEIENVNRQMALLPISCEGE